MVCFNFVSRGNCLDTLFMPLKLTRNDGDDQKELKLHEMRLYLCWAWREFVAFFARSDAVMSEEILCWGAHSSLNCFLFLCVTTRDGQCCDEAVVSEVGSCQGHDVRSLNSLRAIPIHTMKLFLIRHGETEHNVQGLL